MLLTVFLVYFHIYKEGIKRVGNGLKSGSYFCIGIPLIIVIRIMLRRISVWSPSTEHGTPQQTTTRRRGRQTTTWQAPKWFEFRGKYFQYIYLSLLWGTWRFSVPLFIVIMRYLMIFSNFIDCYSAWVKYSQQYNICRFWDKITKKLYVKLMTKIFLDDIWKCIKLIDFLFTCYWALFVT